MPKHWNTGQLKVKSFFIIVIILCAWAPDILHVSFSSKEREEGCKRQVGNLPTRQLLKYKMIWGPSSYLGCSWRKGKKKTSKKPKEKTKQKNPQYKKEKKNQKKKKIPNQYFNGNFYYWSSRVKVTIRPYRNMCGRLKSSFLELNQEEEEAFNNIFYTIPLCFLFINLRTLWYLK